MSTYTWSDRELVDLYEEWSQDTWAATWISGGEEAFVGWLLNRRPAPLEGYQREGVAKIREILDRRLITGEV